MIRWIALFGLLALVVVALFAQTTVDVTRMDEGQLRGRETTAGSIWITLPEGMVRQAVIESGYWDLIFQPGSGIPPILRPKLGDISARLAIVEGQVAALTTQLQELKAKMDTMTPGTGSGYLERNGVALLPDGTNESRRYVLTERWVPGSLRVYRNGLRQTESADVDFTTDADACAILFVPYYANDADPVVVDYDFDPASAPCP